VAERDTIADEVLKRCERAYLEDNVPEALEDAVLFCNGRRVPYKLWMRKALAEREAARLVGKPKKKKPGRRTDFRNHVWFTMVQDRRDEGQSRKRAISETLDELKYEGEYITRNLLEKVYKDHRALLRRGIPYVPRLSAGFSPKKSSKTAGTT
jgi:hypothetical protein